MSELYFRPRKVFDFSNATLDIGTWAKTWNRKHLNRFVIRRIIAIGIKRFPKFYHHHLNHYQETQAEAQESAFHQYLFELLDRYLRTLKAESPFAENNAQNQEQITIVSAALDFLASIDRWNLSETVDETITRQQIRITELEKQKNVLETTLKEYKQLDTNDYINITEGYRDTVLDLMLQIQDLKLPDGKELVLSQTQAAWTKMICKYFREGDQEIKHDTIRRYFPSDKREPGVKHAAIKDKFKLFQIKNSRKIL